MRKIYLPALCLVLFVAAALVAYSAGGDQNDPVVTQSYLERVWSEEFTADASATAAKALNHTYNNALQSLAQTVAQQRRQNDEARTQNRKSFGRLTLKQGDVIYPAAGCKLTLYSGAVSCDTTLINVTNGTPGGTAMAARILYMQSDADSPGLTVTTATAELLVNGVYKLTPSAGVDYGSLADALFTMGLFKGATYGYELEGPATRAQGLVMFLRLLGREDEALSCTDAVPFTDVPAGHWARPYVAYAYKNGLTTGVTAAEFQPDAAITAQHYLTFLFRALSYTEGSAFTYESALTDAVKNGLFSQKEVDAMSAGTFRRHKMVYLSYYALFCENGETAQPLLETLLDAGVVSEGSAYAGLSLPKGWRMD